MDRMELPQTPQEAYGRKRRKSMTTYNLYRMAQCILPAAKNKGSILSGI